MYKLTRRRYWSYQTIVVAVVEVVVPVVVAAVVVVTDADENGELRLKSKAIGWLSGRELK